MASASVSGAAGASDLLRSSCSGANGEGFPLRSLARRQLGANFWGGGSDSDTGAVVVAKIRKEKRHDYPWPGSNEIDPRAKRGQIGYLSHFKPLKEKPKPVTLPFEKPLMDLRKKIADVKRMADETGLDLNDQINSLEDKYQLALRDLYAHLTPIQRLSIARHPHRPTFLDHVLNITDKWVELHGDRAGYDDPAIVCGIGSMDGGRYMFMGHQKGRNTKENMARNFGMPTPHGYRKALRMMHHADHHGFPIITFIDTPGAFADLKSEEMGQGEAIAQNLRTMFGLKVPVISLVIGEGGSGGALAIGCANKLLMLENSVFYVASPEACAAILWKTSKAAGKAAEKLRITASELCRLKIADGIIPEPLGGAHTDPSWTSRQIKVAILEAMEELSEMETPALLQHRMLKFRHLGGIVEGEPVDPCKKVNMKKREEAPFVPEERQPQQQQEEVSEQVAGNLGEEIEKLKQQILNSSKTPGAASTRTPVLGEMIARLKEEVDQEFAAAAKTMGFVERMETLRKELAKAGSSSALDSGLKEKIQRLRQEFGESLPQCPNFDRLNEKLSMLKDAETAKKASEGNARASSLKQEVSRALKSVMERPDIREKVEILRAEISDAGVVRSSSQVDPDLKQRMLKVKREVEVELVKALEALRLSVEAVVSPKGEDENPPENQTDLDLGEEMEELEDEIGERIRKAIKSRDLDAKLEMLKMEVCRSGTSPDPETKERIERMKQRVKQDLAEAVSSPELMEKFDRLRQEMARRKETASSPAVEVANALF